MTSSDLPAHSGIDGYVRVSDLRASPDALSVLEDELPEQIAMGGLDTFAGFPLGVFLQVVLKRDPSRMDRVLARLSALPDPTPAVRDDRVPAPSPGYEGPDVPPATSVLETPADARVHALAELVLRGPSHGNPFVDVDLEASLTAGEHTVRVGGFYDGDGVYRIRFLPPAAGRWDVVVRSNARSLDGVTGSLDVAASDAPGPVRVDGADGFRRADGSVFIPLGTTAYAWTHQPEELQERTLAALAGAPFTKLRMGLFPKSFIYNTNEPERFVFPRAADGSFDLQRFDVAWFREFERRLTQLGDLGIEADLILFHPYDRWGLAALGPSADDRYVRYVVRRLAAFPNVWWSLANEYELVTAKRPEDWDRIGRLVEAEDHVGHPRSVHDIIEPYDASASWVTHCSLQTGESERVPEWHERWGKPVLIDEMGYEGDLDQGWGSLTADELLLRSWQVALGGGYPTHGETFWSEDEVIFWAKGGDLVGETPTRLGFLRDIVAASPTGRLAPMPSEFDAMWAGVPGQYVLIHFGRGRPRFRSVPIPAGHVARVQVIDGWEMTVTEVPGVHRGTVRVDLPARMHVLVRLLLEPESGSSGR